MLMQKLLGATKSKQWSFISSSFYQTPSNSSSITVSKPTDVVAGDILLWFGVCSGASTSFTYTPTSGWTEIKDQGAPPDAYIMYKIATSSEPSSYTVTASSSSTVLAATILCLRGLSYQNIGTLAVSTTASVTAPSITIANNNSLLIMYAGINGTNRIFSTPAGMTNILQTGSSTNLSIAAFYEERNAGSTGTRTTTWTTARNAAAVLIGFNITG